MTTESYYDAPDTFNTAVSLYRKHCEKDNATVQEPARELTDFSYTPDGEGVRVMLKNSDGDRLYQVDIYSGDGAHGLFGEIGSAWTRDLLGWGRS